MYYISRNWGASVAGGILAALLLAFDMLAQIEGRLVLVSIRAPHEVVWQPAACWGLELIGCPIH